MNDLNHKFISKWEEERKMDLEATRVFWETKAHSYNKGIYEEKQRKSKIVDMILEKGIINEESRVLDIGAGPGNHAIPFAKLVKDVTAFDISNEMVKYLLSNAEKEGVSYIFAFNSSWEDIDIEEKQMNKSYDLVFASMTPAVSNFESLQKMNEASKGYCYLSGFVYRQDSIWDEIRNNILKLDKDTEKQNKVYYAFNILWNMEIYPDVEYYQGEHIHRFATEDLVEMYTQKSQASVKDIDANSIEKISEFIRSKAVDGIVEEEMKSKSAALIWKAI